MSGNIVVSIRKLVVEFVGFFVGKKAAENVKDTPISHAIGEDVGWISGIHLNKAIDREIARNDKDSVYYPDYLEEKMKLHEDHLLRYKNQLSKSNQVER